MPEEKPVEEVETFLSEQKSLGNRKISLISEEKLMEDRKQALIAGLLKEREAADAAFDEKLAKLGYHANTNRAPEPGEKMPDGTIYAGMSPDTGKAMYATPADASLRMTFNEAKEYAIKLDAHGHKDWRVPTKAELKVLFNNRAAIAGFDISGSNPAGWYWSSSQGDIWGAWGQRFSEGGQLNDTKLCHSTVRCVRSGP